VPAVATTAKIPSRTSGSRASTVARSAAPVIRPRSSPGTSTTSASMITRTACLTEEWVSPVTQTAQRRGRVPRIRSAFSRAATSAERFPIVPPCTKVPPVPAGMPARSAIQRSAWFSAWTAPDPSSHEPL